MRFRRRPTPSLAILLILVLLTLLRLAGRGVPPEADLFDQTVVRIARVVDGDTLLLASGHRIRLIGVDTPETKHPDRPVERLGLEASQFTARLIGESEVRLEFDRERRDQYRRILAYVFLPDGRMVNEEIIRAGYSKAQVSFPYRADRKRLFREAQETAKAEQRGIWAVKSQSELTGPPALSGHDAR